MRIHIAGGQRDDAAARITFAHARRHERVDRPGRRRILRGAELEADQVDDVFRVRQTDDRLRIQQVATHRLHAARFEPLAGRGITEAADGHHFEDVSGGGGGPAREHRQRGPHLAARAQDEQRTGNSFDELDQSGAGAR